MFSFRLDKRILTKPCFSTILDFNRLAATTFTESLTKWISSLAISRLSSHDSCLMLLAMIVISEWPALAECSHVAILTCFCFDFGRCPVWWTASFVLFGGRFQSPVTGEGPNYSGLLLALEILCYYVIQSGFLKLTNSWKISERPFSRIFRIITIHVDMILLHLDAWYKILALSI